MKIVADDKVPFLKGVFEPFAEMVYLPGGLIKSNDLKNADAIIIRSITKCNSDLLDGTNIRFIATATIGDDHIDKEYCKSNNIEWSNAAGCNALAVEQYITSALLNLSMDLKLDLSELTIGIIGVGNIGKRISHIASLFGMSVLLNDPPRAKKESNTDFVSLEEILERADIISIHVPLSQAGENKTYHLADKSFFNALKQCKIFINSSRGEVVDTNALNDYLKLSNDCFGILDVWEKEPYIDGDLVKQVHFGTPHIAGYSMEGKANGTAMCVKALSRFFNLEINDWAPLIEKKGQFDFSIDCKGKSKMEILQEATNLCYDIRIDDSNFKMNYTSFEKQRRDYNFRYEAGNYTITLINNDRQSEISALLSKLGFKIN
jgi:erythronate-4-phosphate dehydrogenase